MPKEQEVLRVGDREVMVTNPGKVFFEATGDDEARPRPLLPRRRAGRAGRRRRPADGPQALRQRRRGRGVLPEARARQPARVAAHGHAVVPVRVGRPTRSSSTTRAGLAWIVNLGCIDLNPHPVRADDLDHPDELRVDLDPVPGVGWSQIRDVAMVTKESLESVGLTGWPKTSGLARHPRQRPDRAEVDVPRGPPGGAGDRAGRGAAGARDRHLEVVEGGAPRRVPRLQPEREGPDRRVRLLGAAAARTRESRRRCRGTRSRPSRPRRSRSRPCRRGSRRSATRARGSTRPSGSLEAVLELSRRARGGGAGRRAVAAELPQAGGRAAARPAVAAAPGDGGLRHAGGRGGAREEPRGDGEAVRRGGRSGARRRRRPARPTRDAADAHGPAPVERARHRDLAGEVEGRGARGPRALEGPPSRRPPPPSRSRTCSSTACAAARRSGTGSA